MDRMKSLLENYYGAPSDEHTESSSDLDSRNFNMSKYVSRSLTTTHFPQLLQEDDKLVQEVRNLDADMQLLVYDNYSKFIDATDIIRTMKNKVDDIEADVKVVTSKLENIDGVATALNQRMGPKREKIEKLMRLQSLLRKLNFLFELPLRLKQCIEMDALAQAVSYYSKASPILQRHGEVPSFYLIAQESHQIMLELQRKLKVDCSLPNLSYASYNEKIELYVELSKNLNEFVEDGIRESFLSWNESYLNAEVESLVSSKSSLLAFVTDICAGALELLADTCELYCKLFTHEDDNNLSEFAKPALLFILNSIRTRLIDSDLMDNNSPGHYEPLLEALKFLISNLKGHRLGAYVKPLNLSDRTAEICEVAMRKQVVNAFDSLRLAVMECVIQAGSQENIDPKDLAIEIQECIGKTMAELDVLLDAASELLADMSAIFENLIKFQLRFWVLWFCNVLECFVDPYPVYRKGGVPHLVTLVSNNERNSILVDCTPDVFCTSSSFFFVLVGICEEMRLYVRKSQMSGAPELMNELDVTKDAILVSYVKFQASLLCKKILSFEEQEQLGVRPEILDIVETLSTISRQVTKHFPGIVQTPQPNTNRYQRHGASANVHHDIERIFHEKVLHIMEPVELTPVSVVTGVLRIVLKTLVEHIRGLTLRKTDFHQYEIDVYYLRSTIPLLLGEKNSVQPLLNLVASAVRDAAVDTEPLAPEIIERYSNSARQASRLSFLKN